RSRGRAAGRPGSAAENTWASARRRAAGCRAGRRRASAPRSGSSGRPRTGRRPSSGRGTARKRAPIPRPPLREGGLPDGPGASRNPASARDPSLGSRGSLFRQAPQLPRQPEHRPPPQAVPARQVPDRKLETIGRSEKERRDENRVDEITGSPDERPERDRPDEVVLDDPREKHEHHQEQQQTGSRRLQPSKAEDGGERRDHEERGRSPVGNARDAAQHRGPVIFGEAGVSEEPAGD